MKRPPGSSSADAGFSIPLHSVAFLDTGCSADESQRSVFSTSLHGVVFFDTGCSAVQGRSASQLMRIIAGQARGRRLKTPDSKGTRPATDRVREAVFSSIGNWVEDAVVADLYAGSGSFGLEALSRGAASAVFVEKGRKALKALRANVETVGLGGTIIESSVQDYLRRANHRFHLVFCDPPWDDPTSQMESDLTALNRLLLPSGEVIVSRRHTDRPPTAPENWRVATDKRYGDTRIIRYEKVEDVDDGAVPGEL